MTECLEKIREKKERTRRAALNGGRLPGPHEAEAEIIASAEKALSDSQLARRRMRSAS